MLQRERERERERERVGTRLAALAAAVLAGVAACTGDDPARATGPQIGLPAAFSTILHTGSTLQIYPEITNGVVCSFARSTQAADTMMFNFPNPNYPGTPENPEPKDIAVVTIGHGEFQTLPQCDLLEAGYVWPTISTDFQTEFRPRIDLTLVTESYEELPVPGTVQLTGASGACQWVGWRIPGQPAVQQSTISFSTASSTSFTYNAVLDCGGSGGPLAIPGDTIQ